jgi:hypothetical protein
MAPTQGKQVATISTKATISQACQKSQYKGTAYDAETAQLAYSQDYMAGEKRSGLQANSNNQPQLSTITGSASDC